MGGCKFGSGGGSVWVQNGPKETWQQLNTISKQLAKYKTMNQTPTELINCIEASAEDALALANPGGDIAEHLRSISRNAKRLSELIGTQPITREAAFAAGLPCPITGLTEAKWLALPDLPCSENDQEAPKSGKTAGGCGKCGQCAASTTETPAEGAFLPTCLSGQTPAGLILGIIHVAHDSLYEATSGSEAADRLRLIIANATKLCELIGPDAGNWTITPEGQPVPDDAEVTLEVSLEDTDGLTYRKRIVKL